MDAPRKPNVSKVCGMWYALCNDCDWGYWCNNHPRAFDEAVEHVRQSECMSESRRARLRKSSSAFATLDSILEQWIKEIRELVPSPSP